MSPGIPMPLLGDALVGDELPEHEPGGAAVGTKRARVRGRDSRVYWQPQPQVVRSLSGEGRVTLSPRAELAVSTFGIHAEARLAVIPPHTTALTAQATLTLTAAAQVGAALDPATDDEELLLAMV